MASQFPPALRTPGTKPPMPVEQEMPMQPEPATEQRKVVISPEMVAFRSADETCANCHNYAQDGNCAVLEMTVEPGDGCMAFAEREDGASDIEDPGMEMESDDVPPAIR
jgi:hypothetical protein